MNEPQWKWIAQDLNGSIAKYATKPDKDHFEWFESPHDIVQKSGFGLCAENWQSSLINLETHDYKIEDGILIKVEKQNKKRHKHADLMIAYAKDKTLQIQAKYTDDVWRDCTPVFDEGIEYRIKPKTKPIIIKFRNYLDVYGRINVHMHTDITCYDFKEWIGDWQKVEISE